AGLAHAARNQLRVLAAEIEDQDHRLRSTIAITEITLTLKYTGPGAAYETPSRRCSTTLRPRRFDARCGPVAALAARPCRRTALHPRAASAPKIEPERRADKFQRLSKSGFDEAYIMRRDAVFDVGEESKTRRCAADLRHVHQVQAPPIHLRRIHRCRRFGQRSIQPRSLKDCAPRISRPGRSRDDPVHAVACDRRSEHHRRIVEERVALVRVVDESRHLAPLLRRYVPFVAHDYHRA